MIGIVGCGHVGDAMMQLFPNAAKYDKFLEIGTKDEINLDGEKWIHVKTMDECYEGWILKRFIDNSL